MRPCKAKAGTDIFREGDLSGTYFIILDGKCQIQINKVPRKIIAFGESFGDLGIIYNAPRSATVHALTDCYLAAMDRVCFKLLMDRLHLAAKS